MRGYILAIACVGFVAGCANDGRYDRESWGYGTSLSMAGGSGVRGVYPDAAMAANRFAVTNEYAGRLMASLAPGGAAFGAPAAETNVILGAGASSSTTIVEAEVSNPFAPTIELIVPTGFASQSVVIDNTESSAVSTETTIAPPTEATTPGQTNQPPQTTIPVTPPYQPQTPPATSPAPTPTPPELQTPPEPTPPPVQEESTPAPTPQLQPQSAPLSIPPRAKSNKAV
jgi:hypothetical protein